MLEKIKSMIVRIREDGLVAEIIFLTFKVAESLLEPVLKLFLYQEVCVRLMEGLSESLCSHISQHPQLENKLQQEAAIYLTLHKVIISFPGLLLCIFCGSWSDRVGRRLPVIISCLLSIIGVVFFIIAGFVPPPMHPNNPLETHLSNAHNSTTLTPFSNNSTYDSAQLHQQQHNWNHNNTIFLLFIFLGSLIRGFSGKSSLVTMAVHSYVSDVSEKDDRTERLGRLLSMNFFGLFLGSLFVGILTQVCTFYVVFIIVIILYTASILLAHFLMVVNGSDERLELIEELPDEKNNRENDLDENGEEMGYIEEGTPDENEALEECESLNQKFSFRKFISLNTSIIKDFFSLLIDFRDKKVFLYFVIIVVQQTCKSGEIDVTLLYTAKSPLNWSKSLYGYFLALDYACLGLSTAILLPILIVYFKARDISLAVVGMAFKVVRLVILSMSSSTSMIFLAVILCCPSALIISSLKSLISKNFEPNELGKLFAFLSGSETLSNLVGNVLFNTLYLNTIQIYPGFTFLIDALLFCLLMFVLIISEVCLHPSSSDKLIDKSFDQNALTDGEENKAFLKQEDYRSISGQSECQK